MLATLTVLAIAEHWFLVAPLSTNALWQFGVKTNPKKGELEDRDAFANAGEDRRDMFEDNASAPATANALGVDAWTLEDQGLRPALESFGGRAPASR